MSDKAFMQFVAEVRDACDRYLKAKPVQATLAGVDASIKAESAKKPRVKGNPICRCGHMYSVHEQPHNVMLKGKPVPANICRGCDADGQKLGCPEFVAKGKLPTKKSNGAAPTHEPDFGGNEFSMLELAILAALKVNSHQGWTANQLATLTVYVQSGTFNGAIADLREMGLIEGSPELQLTDAGKQVALDMGAGYDAISLREAWGQKYGKLGARIINELAKSSASSSALLAERCGYVQSGTFNQMIAKMRRMGLIEEKLPLRLCQELL